MSLNLALLLQFALILLVLALTVAAIFLIMILFDVRQVTTRIKKEVKAVTFLVDMMDVVLGAIGFAKKKISGSKIAKTVRKTLKIVNEEDD